MIFNKFSKFFKIKGNVDSIIVCGTTGESSTMTIEERKETIVLSLNKKTGRLFHEGKDKNVILSVNRNTGEVDSMDEDDKVILSLPKNRLVIELDQNTGQVKYKYPSDIKVLLFNKDTGELLFKENEYVIKKGLDRVIYHVNKEQEVDKRVVLSIFKNKQN